MALWGTHTHASGETRELSKKSNSDNLNDKQKKTTQQKNGREKETTAFNQQTTKNSWTSVYKTEKCAYMQFECRVHTDLKANVSQCIVFSRCVCVRASVVIILIAQLKRAKNCSAHCCLYLWSCRQMCVTFTCFHLSTSKKRTNTFSINERTNERTACTILLFCSKTINSRLQHACIHARTHF